MSNSAKAKLDNGVNWIGDLCGEDQNKFKQKIGDMLRRNPVPYMNDETKKIFNQLTRRYSDRFKVQCDMNKSGEWVISMIKRNG